VFFAIKNAVAAAREEFATEAGVPSAAGPFNFYSPATPERIRLACLDFMHPADVDEVWHARV
jgi:hypothetical protein